MGFPIGNPNHVVVDFLFPPETARMVNAHFGPSAAGQAEKGSPVPFGHIYGKVKPPSPNLPEEMEFTGCSLPEGQRLPIRVENQDFIQERIAGEHFLRAGVYQSGNIGSGKCFPEYADGGNHEEDISDVPEADEKDSFDGLAGNIKRFHGPSSSLNLLYLAKV